MSSEWPVTTIGEQLTLQRGFDITKAIQQPGNIPVISSGGMNSFHSTAMVKGPGVVLGRKGIVGSVYFVSGDYWPHDTTLWIKDFHGNDELFAYYFFLAKAKELAQLDVGSANPTLNRNHVHPIKVQWPSLCEQKLIGRVLGALDEHISLLRETNSTLEAIAQALFKSWFVDFDPVRAKVKGLDPEGMDATTAALFPDSFEESELCMVPSGWEYCRVENLADKVGMGPFGSNIKVETFVNEGVPVISGQHLRQVLVEDSTFNFITDTHAKKLSNSCVHEGDVIFTHAGSIGQVALLHRHARYDRYVLSQRQFFLRCNRLKMQPEWITYYFRSAQGQYQLLANTSQVGVPSIARPVSYLRSIEVLVPPKELIDKFSDIADALHQTILAKRMQIQSLTRLRDTLLPRLISGQMRLPEMEAAVENAVFEAN
jgi:type I restriction enzyme S subunit